MLMYCEKCQLVFDGADCPACGEKNVREPASNDPCFLCEKQIMWGEMLEEALNNNRIPVFIKKKLGAGMALKVGPMMEYVKVYVPYSRLKDAQSIAEELFNEVDCDGIS